MGGKNSKKKKKKKKKKTFLQPSFSRAVAKKACPVPAPMADLSAGC